MSTSSPLSTWQRSSYSNGSGGNCVEAAEVDALILVRDSKAPHGPRLDFTSAAWSGFVRELKYTGPSRGFDGSR
jgi:hypothetical protein